MGSALSVTPSSGHARAIHQTEFERSLSLIDRADRAPLQEASFNSSYLEAIIDDLTRSGAEGTTAPVDTAWERYGRALHRAIAEALEEVRPHALETADYWISVGLTIGLDRPHQARRLLELVEAEEAERAALAEDAAAFVEEALG